MDLHDALCIVTGGGAGLGRVLALALADAGAGVIVADIDGAAAEETAELARRHGVPGSAVQVDILDGAAAERLVQVAQEAGGPHVLINNAGGWTPARQYPHASAAEWGATLDLNLRAPMLLSQLVLDPMAALGGGVIVNIASVAGIGSTGYGSPEYAAAKAGLIRFTTSLTDLEKSHGVHVVCVVPDWIGLDRAHAQFAALPPAQRAATAPLIPPEEVVAVTLDLIRSGCSGAVVEMRGGEAPRLRGGSPPPR